MRPHPAVAEPVRLADELHHELACRLVIQLRRAADLFDARIVHHRDLARHVHCLGLVVGDEDGGHVHLVMEATQPFAQLGPNAGVECAERLIEQQNLRLRRERASERHSLALPAGELRRIAVAESLELNELQELVDPVPDLGLRTLAHLEPEGDVVANGHVLERRVMLKDEPDVAVLWSDAGRVLARDHDLTLVG